MKAFNLYVEYICRYAAECTRNTTKTVTHKDIRFIVKRLLGHLADNPELGANTSCTYPIYN
jgi:hypothetical protein